MTSDDFPRHLTARIIEFAKIIGAVTVISSTLLAVWATAWGPVRDFRAQFYALVYDVGEFKEALVQLKADVARATGDNRIIRQVSGLSYVEEPVYQNENVVLLLVVARTLRGQHCRLLEWVPLFNDERGVLIAGKPAEGGPPQQQINTEVTRLRLEIKPPSGLLPGRVELHLVLTYLCQGESAYDRTDSLIYELLPGSRPTSP